jgi:hypothetical protein
VILSFIFKDKGQRMNKGLGRDFNIVTNEYWRDNEARAQVLEQEHCE